MLVLHMLSLTKVLSGMPLKLLGRLRFLGTFLGSSATPDPSASALNDSAYTKHDAGATIDTRTSTLLEGAYSLPQYKVDPSAVFRRFSEVVCLSIVSFPR